MARIHMPRQRKSDKRWDYTVSSDEEKWVHPVGYCADWTDPDAFDARAEKLGHPKLPQESRERLLRFKDKFHSHGHETAEEAEECHQQYMLDFEVRKYTSENEMHKCGACGEWTKDRVSIGDFCRFDLCEKHQSRESIEAMLQRAS